MNSQSQLLAITILLLIILLLATLGSKALSTTTRGLLERALIVSKTRKVGL